MMNRIADRLAQLPRQRQKQIVNVVFGELLAQPWLNDLERQLLKARQRRLEALLAEHQRKTA